MVSEKNYFDHEADIGIIGFGKTLEAAFCNGAEALFALTTELTEVETTKFLTIQFEEDALDFAFVRWLNLLIAKAQAEHMIFTKFALTHVGNQWIGELSGDHWRKGYIRHIEVKGATLTELKVIEVNNEWKAQCVVDV